MQPFLFLSHFLKLALSSSSKITFQGSKLGLEFGLGSGIRSV